MDGHDWGYCGVVDWREVTVIKLQMQLFGILIIVGGIGCSQEPGSNTDPSGPGGGPAAVNSSHRESDDSTLLPTPFTAEEIRDEWIEGFQIVIQRRSPSEERLERWTVVRADEDGAVIEYADIDAYGNVSGEPTIQRSSWQELRDHASFAADHASRERVVRQTPLGEFEGWLYIVGDNESGTTTRFFFASELPGAPVAMEMVDDGTTLVALEQLERYRPAG
jgi:hypothetical protein